MEKISEQFGSNKNLANFSQIAEGERDLNTVSKLILSEMVLIVNAQHGSFYIMENMDEESDLKLFASYTYSEKLGENIIEECMLENKKVLLTNIPSDYIQNSSGLNGLFPPSNIMILPVLFEGQIKAIIELASFERFNFIELAFLAQLTKKIGIILNSIENYN